MKIVLVSGRERKHDSALEWGCIENERLFLLEKPVIDSLVAARELGRRNSDCSGFSGLVKLIDSMPAKQSGVTSLFSKPAEINDYQLHAPIQSPEKVICIGRNYADHAAEMGGEAPEIPVVFGKFASAIADPDSDVLLPAISDQVDYEAELVVVIGRTGHNIKRESAIKHVFGYTCGNDVSARDWQKGRPGGQWLPGKSFDTFAPIGPLIVTTHELADPHNLDIRMRLNGTEMQHGNTRDLIFPIDHLIAHVSQFFTLRPGDLIFTGTPSGVGAGRNPPVFLQPGDQMEVEISGIGVLRNGIALRRSP